MRAIDADALKTDLTRFYDGVVTAKQLIDEQPTVYCWISVEDTLPEMRHVVLAFSPHHNNIWALSLHEDGFWYYWADISRRYDPLWMGPITKWMPLPEPPKEDDGDAR